MIAKDCAATGIILKELYSTSVEYSANLLDTIQLDGAEYRIYVFLVNKKFGETCSHNWKLEKRTEATCLSSGSEKYVCSICSKTEVKTLPALGHVDEMVTPHVTDVVSVQRNKMAGTGSRQRIGHPGVNIRCSLSV